MGVRMPKKEDGHVQKMTLGHHIKSEVDVMKG